MTNPRPRQKSRGAASAAKSSVSKLDDNTDGNNRPTIAVPRISPDLTKSLESADKAVAAVVGAAQAVALPGVDDWSAKPSKEHPRPVVLVHGTFGNAANYWTTTAPLLAAAGYLVYRLDYGAIKGVPFLHGLGPIRDGAKELAAFVDKVLAATGASKVDLVGHSQGGMMPRYYLKFLGGADKVHQLIALAPSNHGTTVHGLATLAGQFPGGAELLAATNPPACEDQIAGSPFLTELNAGSETVPTVLYTVIATRYDQVVTPYTSCWLKGDNVRNVLMQDLQRTDLSEHGLIASSPVAFRQVIKILNAADAAKDRPADSSAGESGTERLNGLDRAFLHLDAAGVPLNLGGLAVFEPTVPVSPDELVGKLTERIARQPRFRKRIRMLRLPPGAAKWEDDPDFQPEAHIRLCSLPAPGSVAEATEYASKAMSRALDLDRPPWELHVLVGLPDGAFGLLLKMHHALADGVAAANLAASLLDEPTPLLSYHDSADEPEITLQDALQSLTRPDQWLTTPAALTTQAANRITAAGRRASSLLGVAASVLANVRPQSVATLNNSSSSQRRLSVTRLDPGILAGVREQHGATAHDVVLTVLSGALRAWLGHRGQDTGHSRLRALIPVSTRMVSQADGGNLLSGYLSELPVDEADPLQRLSRVRAAMRGGKYTGQGQGAGRIASLAAALPAPLQRVMLPIAGRGANALYDLLITYIPLPDRPLTIAGARQRETYPIVPLAKGQGLSIAVANHRGSVDITLYSDPRLVPDVAVLADAIPKALAELASVPVPVP